MVRWERFSVSRLNFCCVNGGGAVDEDARCIVGLRVTSFPRQKHVRKLDVVYLALERLGHRNYG